jgi:leucyl aminopeptidase
VPEKQWDGAPLRALDRRLKGKLRERLQNSKFTGSEGSSLLLPTLGLLPSAHLLIIGSGGAKEMDCDSWRKSAARARKEAANLGALDIAFFFPDSANAPAAGAAITEGALLAAYQFNKYRSNGKPAQGLNSLTLFRPGMKRTAALANAVAAAQKIVAAVCLARDLVNEPPSVTTARFLGAQAQRHCQGRGLSVEVWNKNKIAAMKLNGLLAVNRGSREEPRFIKIHYKPTGKARSTVALIGKGITFDSGGLSLKPSKSMETMKLDMAGGAAVIAAMSRLPQLGLQVEVTGYVPTTDNLPGADAQKPGDVIRYMNGKTIEVLNTDAEGRLVLADALTYTQRKFKPKFVIDLATLTGAIIMALGPEHAGLFSNDDKLSNRIAEAGKAVGEPVWRMPLGPNYDKLLRSKIADMKNIGGPNAGSITAAQFIQRFVENKTPWAHLDIAGVAWQDGEQKAQTPSWGVGWGVRLLNELVDAHYED